VGGAHEAEVTQTSGKCLVAATAVWAMMGRRALGEGERRRGGSCCSALTFETRCRLASGRQTCSECHMFTAAAAAAVLVENIGVNVIALQWILL